MGIFRLTFDKRSSVRVPLRLKYRYRFLIKR
jgi:hypothetical protein